MNIYDSAVLDAITSGHFHLSDICAHTHIKERRVDRALQRLRKAHLIWWESKLGWCLVIASDDDGVLDSRRFLGAGSLTDMLDDTPDTHPRRVKECPRGLHRAFSPSVEHCPMCEAHERETHFRTAGKSQKHADSGRAGGFASAEKRRQR